jgi:hypothetical protein
METSLAPKMHLRLLPDLSRCPVRRGRLLRRVLPFGILLLIAALLLWTPASAQAAQLAEQGQTLWQQLSVTVENWVRDVVETLVHLPRAAAYLQGVGAGV